MRVLHHVWRLSQSGGIPVVVRNLALGLDPARFELHVSTVRPRLSEDALEALDGHLVLHPLNVRGSTRLPRARAVSGLARVTARLRPDVLHLHSGTGWQASGAMAFASKAARILEVHDAPGAGQHGAFTERVEAGMVRRLRFHPLVHSRSVAATVEAATGVEATLIPLGIDTKRFAASSTPRDEWRRSNGIPLDEMLVVWVGRLVPNKNLSLALGVMQRLAATAHPPHLAVIGAGDESSVLLGPREDLVDALHAADIFLSRSNYEGFGLAVLEAMAAGVPVVATAAGGVVDVVDNGVTGILAPVGGEAEVADAVEALIADDALRARLGRAGTTRAGELFTRDVMVAAYESLYERLARSGTG